MSFSQTKIFLLTILLAVGCSKGDIPPNQVKLKYGSTECFHGMGERFSNFFSGKGSPEEIHANWNCMTAILNDFSRVNKTDVFGREKLHSFLNDHYFKENPLSDPLIDSIMQLKQLLAGGDLSSITKSEIEMIVEDLNALDDLSGILVKPLNDQTNLEFISKLPRLGSLIARSQKPYTFEQAKTLVLALADQFEMPGDSLVRKLAELMPTVASAKVLLVAGTADKVMPAEWAPLLTQLGVAYQTFQHTSRVISAYDADISMALGDARLPTIAQNLVTILANAAQARESKRIPLSEISSLMRQLEASGYFPKAFTADQVAIALQFFVAKLFPAPAAAQDSLDQLHVAEMQKFVNRWTQLKTAYESGRVNSVPELSQAVRADNWELGLDSRGRLFVPPAVANKPSLEFPAIFVVIEWLGQKWGTWPLDREHFHAIVTDVLSLLHTFHFLESTDDEVYARLLREANLFMPSSNGNMLLESAEAFQYAVLALSSYRSSHALKVQAKTVCSPEDFECYQDVLWNHRDSLLSNVPKLNVWLGNDQKRFKELTSEIKIISGTTYLMEFMISNYIEIFIHRFDQNGDANIDLSDAMTSYPIYGPVLTEILSKYSVKSDEILTLYTFMLNYGAPPFAMYGGSVRYLYWKWHADDWKFLASRKTLASILAELSKL